VSSRSSPIPAVVIWCSLAVPAAISALLLSPGALDPAPRRFAEVEPGRLYRGGYPDARELRWLAGSVGVRSVVSLMEDSPAEGRSRAEREAAGQLGLRLDSIPMPGNGQADFDLLDAAADAIADGMKRGPVYFHCAAGKQRSNAATAAYRMKHCGWTADRAIGELRRRFGMDAGEAGLATHLREYYEHRIRAQRAATADSPPVPQPRPLPARERQ
jgi:protein-tyrosine phosphatase